MKTVSVAFVSKGLKDKFDALGNGRFEDRELYKFIDKAIDDLKQNPSCGIKVPRKLWPEAYVQNYNITNLFKYDLPNSRRLVYTIKQDDTIMMNIILEWFDHKEYEKRFGY
jgi:hypothetical protein